MSDKFQALLARKVDDQHHCAYEELSLDDLEPGDVTVAVEYSTLNYKDGLAMTGRAPIVRRYPCILGIDFAGSVIDSQHPGFRPGDRVVLNGYGASETRHGGYAGRARISGDLLLKTARVDQYAPRHGHRHRRIHGHAQRHGPAGGRSESR